MKMLMAAIFLVGGILSRAHNGLATGFNDDPLGMTLNDFCVKYDRKVEGYNRRLPKMDFNGFLPANGGRSPSFQSRRNWATIEVSNRWGSEYWPGRIPRFPETIAGRPARIEYTFYADATEDWDVLFENDRELDYAYDRIYARDPKASVLYQWPEWGVKPQVVRSAAARIKLGEILVRFSATDLNLVKAWLTEKYGLPTANDFIAIKSNIGRDVQAMVAVWAVGDERVTVGLAPNESDAEATFVSRSIVGKRLTKIWQLGGAEAGNRGQ